MTFQRSGGGTALADRFGLDGRTALVTGARGGIGRAAAVALAEAGADLVLWGHRDDLDEVAAEVVATGRKARTVAADLADADAVRDVADHVLLESRIDILVNNAAAIHRATALTHTGGAWRNVQRVNVDAIFQLCQLFGAPMCERGRGKIINVASMLSFQGGINVSSYAASKHAVAGLTKALANEWAAGGINVNAVAPGYVATTQTAPLRRDPVRATEISNRIPAGRWAEPADIAGAVVFLASRAADYVHGHTLVVDGGWLAR
jgi:2-dehydro-3-deoxy-D-gluconate 5-dehydrogenase